MTRDQLLEVLDSLNGAQVRIVKRIITLSRKRRDMEQSEREFLVRFAQIKQVSFDQAVYLFENVK